MAGQKRGSLEVEEKSELGHKRMKMCDLEPVSYSKGKVAGEATHPVFDSASGALDLNANVCDASNAVSDGALQCVEGANNIFSPGKQEMKCDPDFVKSRGLGLDLNSEDASTSINNDPFYPNKKSEKLNSLDDSECDSSIGPFKEKDPMRVWKEMKQNGFLSSFHGIVPTSKPRGRKSKSDGFKKKMELARREQEDRFAKIAAPSGLLTGLNPGIINHVRNSKQVHSIIENLVRSEKLENRHSGSKQATQTKSGTKENSESKDLEILNASGMNEVSHSHEDGSLDTLSGDRQISRCPMPVNKTLCSNSEVRGTDSASNMNGRRMFGKFCCASHSKPDCENGTLALKLSSSTEIASEDTSSLSNKNSENLTNVSSLSVKAANVASQWLELLQQDVRGRLAALQRSRKRVRTVIQTELPLLMSKEFSSNQESNPDITRSSVSGCSGNATANAHRVRWNALFDQMYKALSEEEKQLETWLKQVKEMQSHCERGLFPCNSNYSLQQLGASENDYRGEKADNTEKEFAVRAAAASIYSTCNFLMSMQNLPCS